VREDMDTPGRPGKEEANEGGKTWNVLYSTTKSDRN
jgi:hypothetical protein